MCRKLVYQIFHNHVNLDTQPEMILRESGPRYATLQMSADNREEVQ
jgi:hypothetical protein